jgi:hypothetical protein
MIGLAAMGLTMVGVVMLLSDVAFPPALTVLITAAAVIACSILWYAMPLARRRTLAPADAKRPRAAA